MQSTELDYEIIGSSEYSETEINDVYDETDAAEITIKLLNPEEVRWFYRSINSSRKNDFCAFSNYDSLRLETKYQELSAFKGVYSSDSENEKIIVRNNMFEADVTKKLCIPIYWTDPDDEYDIFRGTWFLTNTYEPLNEQLSNAIESTHLMNFGNVSQRLLNTISNKQKKVICTLEYSNYQVNWYGPNEIYLYDTKSIKFKMRRAKLTTGGQKISRGYKHVCVFDNRPDEVTHLCFVVHGIGQKLGGKIHRSCQIMKKLFKKAIKKRVGLKKKLNIQFLPIEWRSVLNLDGGIIDSLTPQEFRGIRTIFNGTVLDILYYSSSMYQLEIAYALESEINRLYSMFCSRNPYFECNGGKLSIIAHSLGSVICYDIMRSWSNEILIHPDVINTEKLNLLSSKNEIMDKIKQILSKRAELKLLEEDINSYLIADKRPFLPTRMRVPNIPSNFKEGTVWKKVQKIDYFFMLGSPLPVFLALRGIKPHGISDHSDILPKSICSRLFNIYYPSDPVAYRIEPLVILDYSNVSPIKIRLKSLIPEIHLDVENATVVSCSSSVYSTDTVSSHEYAKEANKEKCIPSNTVATDVYNNLKRVSVRRKSIIPAVDELQNKLKQLKSYSILTRAQMFIKIMKGQDMNASSSEPYQYYQKKTLSNSNEEYQENSHNFQEMVLQHRLDFVLGNDNTINSFLSLFTSHTSYWKDKDLMDFIIDSTLQTH